MKKQPEITDATRQAFIDVFCEYYLERPIEKITVKEISEKAGYSRVTFYNYFKDTYDILNYIEEDFISYIAREIVSNIEQDKKFKGYIVTFIRIMSGRERYNQVLLNNPNNTRFVNRLKTRLIPLFINAFNLSFDNKKAIYIFEFYIPGIISVISQWMKNNRDVSIEELAEVVEGILKNGVLAQLEA